MIKKKFVFLFSKINKSFHVKPNSSYPCNICLYIYTIQFEINSINSNTTYWICEKGRYLKICSYKNKHAKNHFRKMNQTNIRNRYIAVPLCQFQISNSREFSHIGYRQLEAKRRCIPNSLNKKTNTHDLLINKIKRAFEMYAEHVNC